MFGNLWKGLTETVGANLQQMISRVSSRSSGAGSSSPDLADAEMFRRCSCVCVLTYYLFGFTALLRDILDEVDRQNDLEFDEAMTEKGGCRGTCRGGSLDQVYF